MKVHYLIRIINLTFSNVQNEHIWATRNFQFDSQRKSSTPTGTFFQTRRLSMHRHLRDYACEPCHRHQGWPATFQKDISGAEREHKQTHPPDTGQSDSSAQYKSRTQKTSQQGRIH